MTKSLAGPSGLPQANGENALRKLPPNHSVDHQISLLLITITTPNTSQPCALLHWRVPNSHLPPVPNCFTFFKKSLKLETLLFGIRSVSIKAHRLRNSIQCSTEIQPAPHAMMASAIAIQVI